MIKIKENTIQDEILVCPYCMNEKNCESMGCCGESDCHFERAITTISGDCYLISEIEIIN